MLIVVTSANPSELISACMFSPGHAFYDAAALLKYSIIRNTYPARSKYNATMYGIVHPEAVICKGPNHEPYDRVRILQDLGYKVVILGSPVPKGILKGYVRSNIDLDSGDRDFTRLYALTYDNHPAVGTFRDDSNFQGNT